MSKSNAQLQSNAIPKRKHHLAAAVISLSAIATTTSAIASTQPFETDNPFESDIPSIVNGSGGSSNIAPGEPTFDELGSLGDIIPSFPGLPDGRFPSSPSGGGSSLKDIFMGGLGDIFGRAGGPAPKIFKDIITGNMGGVLESILGILINQNDIFSKISSVVLGDGWEEMDGDGNPDT